MRATRDQLHRLLNYCIGYARERLEETDALAPFGATLDPEGVVSPIVAREDASEPHASYRQLLDGLREEVAEHRHVAIALAAPVRLPPAYATSGPHGLRVLVETAGLARLVYVPYSIEMRGVLKQRRIVTMRAPIALKLAPELFATS